MQGDPSTHPGLDRPNGEQQQQEEAATAHQSPLLDYERQIVQGLVEEDSLCIMSSGMGWQKVRGGGHAMAAMHHAYTL